MIKLKFFALCIIVSIMQSATAQDVSSKGTKFWLGFMDHTNTTQAEMDLYITSDSSTTGTVYIDGENWSSTFTVTANQVTIVNVPSTTAHVGCSDCIEDKGIRVETAKPVAVYSHIHRNFRSDATLVLPVEATGKTYRVVGWEQESRSTGGERHRSQFMIVASSDNTRINITPTDIISASGPDKQANVTYSITLDKGEVYQAQAPDRYDDLTGTLIEVIDTGAAAACKKISVFSGNTGTRLGCNGGFTSIDNLYEQLFPVNSWGRQFCLVPHKNRSYDRLRVVAHQDNTAVLLNGGVVAVLGAGQFYESGQISTPQFIETSKPSSVAQFQTIQACGSGQGDPAMTMISPIQQTLKDIVVYSSEFERITDNYINVVMKTSDTSTFTIDGAKVPFTTFSNATFYSYAQISVNSGFQQLKSGGDGFIATAYGMGNYESYGYAAGANVKNLAAFFELDNNDKKRNVINTLCLGEEAIFEGKANYEVSKWEWFFGDDSTSLLQNPRYTYKDTGTYNVKMFVTKKTNDGCSAIDSFETTVRVELNPEVYVAFDNVCSGETVEFNDSLVANHPEGTELTLWNFGDGDRLLGRDPTHLYDTAGVYNFEFTVRNKFECTTVYRDSVEVYPLPVAKFSIANTCFKDSVALADSSIAMPYPVNTWIWDMGDGNIDTVSTASHKYLYDTFGTFDVTLTAITEKGCQDTKDTTFTKWQPFIPLFAAESVCLKTDLTAIDTSIVLSDGIDERSWFINDVEESAMVSFSKKMDSAKDYSVKLVLKQNDFCSDSITKTITIYPQLDVDFSVSNTCFQDSTELEAISIPMASANDSFFWNINGLEFEGASQKVVFVDTGANEVILYSKTSNGCFDTLTEDVNIQPKPEASFATNIFCAEDSAIIWNTSEDFGAGLSIVDWASSGRFSMGNPDTFSFVLGSGNRETIKLVIATADGCKDTAEQEVVIYPKPQVSISAVSHCFGEVLSLINNTTNDSGEVITWSWDFGNNAVAADSLPSYTYPLANSYKIKLGVTSTFGCFGIDSTDVEVYELPVADARIDNACFGENVLVDDLSTSNSGLIANTVFVLADGTRMNGPNASLSFSSPGNQDIRVVTRSSFGCLDSSSFTAVVHPIPVSNFGAIEDKGCDPFDVEFVDSSTISGGNIVNWRWESAGVIFSNSSNPINQFSQPGFKDVKLVVQSDSGCVDSVFKQDFIEIFSSPVAYFAYNPLEPTIIDNEVSFRDSSLGNIQFWNWDFGDGNSSTEEDPINTFLDTGLYRVSLLVTDDNNCEGDTFRNIYIEPAFFVFVPNSFSPNGDGLNEAWGPEGVLQGVVGYELQIFNRWGEILFESNNPNEKWDGTYQGSPVQEGYYGFRMRYTDFGRSKWINNNGSLLLLK